MNAKTTYWFTLALALLLFLPAGAYADSIILIFNPATLTGSPGDLLTYSGTLTNSSDAPLYLNAGSLTLDAAPDPGATDLTPLFWNVTMSDQNPLSAGASLGPVDLFTLTIPDVLAPGTYQGTLFVQGGAAEDSDAVLGSQTFSVVVNGAIGSDVPEPASFSLAGLALGALAFRYRRRRGAAA